MKKIILILIVGGLSISCGAKIKINPVEYYDKHGNRKGLEDCEGVPNGKAIIDMCGVCDIDATNDCIQDCTGEWGGPYEVAYFYMDIDGDGLGSGDANELCEGFDLTGWVSNHDDSDDNCYSNIHDCANICDGQAFIDDCDNCVGGNTNLEPCSK